MGPYAGTGKLEDMAWCHENSRDTTQPVGQKSGNGFGLHDMLGNVIEWCEDVFDWGFYTTPEAAGLDPVCTSDSDFRLLRGGAFRDLHVYARCATRYRFPQSFRSDDLGFRVVASPF
jgi:formylglycine-generating enzyme required for sulfatase activity